MFTNNKFIYLYPRAVVSQCSDQATTSVSMMMKKSSSRSVGCIRMENDRNFWLTGQIAKQHSRYVIQHSTDFHKCFRLQGIHIRLIIAVSDWYAVSYGAGIVLRRHNIFEVLEIAQIYVR